MGDDETEPDLRELIAATASWLRVAAKWLDDVDERLPTTDGQERQIVVAERRRLLESLQKMMSAMLGKRSQRLGFLADFVEEVSAQVRAEGIVAMEPDEVAAALAATDPPVLLLWPELDSLAATELTASQRQQLTDRNLPADHNTVLEFLAAAVVDHISHPGRGSRPLKGEPLTDLVQWMRYVASAALVLGVSDAKTARGFWESLGEEVRRPSQTVAPAARRQWRS